MHDYGYCQCSSWRDWPGPIRFGARFVHSAMTWHSMVRIELHRVAMFFPSKNLFLTAFDGLTLIYRVVAVDVDCGTRKIAC